MVVFISFVMFFFAEPCEEFKSQRDAFFYIDSEKKLTTYLKDTKNSTCNDLKPYIYAALMLRAKYESWPHKKLHYFSEGKKLLETYIKNNPSSIEARFLRWNIQREVPWFLNYSSKIKNDKKYILKNISSSKLSEKIKKNILSTLKKK